MENNLVVSIVGTGYVGLTTAAVLANAGFKVYTIDIDEKKISMIKSGKSYFFEAGLDEFVKNGVESGNLIPTLSYEESIPESDIVLSCVGTPDNPDGSPNLEYIYSAAESIAKNAKDGVVIIQKSTVPVGTGRQLMQHINKVQPNLKSSYVSNPEFLREGSALFDTLNMDRLVAGSDDKEALEKLVNIFKKVNEFSQNIDHSKYNAYADAYVSKINTFNHKSYDERVFKMGLESAELVKVSANAFLALKISFANSIAKLADEAGADINDVMNGVGSDFRIGRAFLYPGLGWGGGCFPKDVSGLISVAEDFGVPLPIMDAAVAENAGMADYVIEQMKSMPGSDSVKKVAVLGLSFKPGTSDARKSPAIKLVNKLVDGGYEVVAYDPQAMEEAKHEGLTDKVQLADSIDGAVEGVDAVIMATDWKEFKGYDWKKGKELMSRKIFVDGRNCMDKEEMEGLGFVYKGVGR